VVRPYVVVALAACAACGRVDFDGRAIDAHIADVGDVGDAPPPIRFVQASQVGSSDNASSQSVVLATAPVVGDLIVLVAWTFSAASTAANDGFTDGEGNVYHSAIAVKTGVCAGKDGVLAIYYAIVTANTGAPLQVSYTPAGDGTQGIDIMAIEYAGLGSAALDRTASLVTPPGTSPHMFASGTTAALSVDDELVVGAGYSCSGSPDNVMWTDDAGFTTRGQTTSTLTDNPGIVGDKIVDQGGTYSDAWTVTYQADNEVELGVIATFF
jgi:hypothetical protein